MAERARYRVIVSELMADGRYVPVLRCTDPFPMMKVDDVEVMKVERGFAHSKQMLKPLKRAFAGVLHEVQKQKREDAAR